MAADIKNNTDINTFIEKNMGFICSCVSSATGHFVDKSDDVFQEALIAFNAAIQSFDEEKGELLPYAKRVIYNRIYDYLRKQKKHSSAIPFSSLALTNERGEELALELEDTRGGISEAGLEIYSIKTELSLFDIDFFELAKKAPKFKRTRKSCTEIARYIAKNEGLLNSLYLKKQLPAAEVCKQLKISRKLTDKFRQYIIAGVLIVNGNYDIIREYFDGGSQI